jgi:hypothetical protein
MGRLREKSTGRCLELSSETTVGRSPKNVLQLALPHVSASHAAVRWSDDHWTVRDLGSRNGTWLDGQRLAVRQSRPLAISSTLGFGGTEGEWEVVDDSPPAVLLESLLGGLARSLKDGPVPLPKEGNAIATVFLDRDGSVVLETDRERRLLRDRDVFEVAGEAYRASVPDVVLLTTHPSAQRISVSEAGLFFRVSSNEEHVAVEIDLGGERTALAPRAHNYVLLVLARRRLEERARGIGIESEGWIVQDELCDMLRVDRQRLNTDIFRIRKQLTGLGLADPVNMIERRLDSRELRVGTPHLRIEGSAG